MFKKILFNLGFYSVVNLPNDKFGVKRNFIFTKYMDNDLYSFFWDFDMEYIDYISFNSYEEAMDQLLIYINL